MEKPKYHLKSVIGLILCIAVIIACFAVLITSHRKINATYYVEATLSRAQIFPFENDAERKLLNINDKAYIATIDGLPAHAQDGDTVVVAIDAEGHIVTDMVHLVDGVLYGSSEGSSVDEVFAPKLVNYDEYMHKTSESYKVKEGFKMFIAIFIFVSMAFVDVACLIDVIGDREAIKEYEERVAKQKMQESAIPPVQTNDTVTVISPPDTEDKQ